MTYPEGLFIIINCREQRVGVYGIVTRRRALSHQFPFAFNYHAAAAELTKCQVSVGLQSQKPDKLT